MKNRVSTPRDVRIYRDAEEVAAEAAGWLHQLISASTERFSICLSGGSTPELLYETLARPPRAPGIPWQRIHWFWGDERFVPPHHPNSNYRMARSALLDPIRAPAENVHPVNTQLETPAAAADAYERTLHRFYGSDRVDPGKSLFDVVLLGIGEDGHTASLFPGAPAIEEKARWVGPVIGFRPEPRITLTFPALRSSRHVAFLVCGAAKRQIISEIFAGADLPARRVISDGTIHWFMDQAAAPR